MKKDTYTAIFRTKRHYNFQQDFGSIEAFDFEVESAKKEIVWAVLIRCDGAFIKKVDGYYV